MGRSGAGVERSEVGRNRVLLFMWVLCLLHPSCPVKDREGQRDDPGICEVPYVAVSL